MDDARDALPSGGRGQWQHAMYTNLINGMLSLLRGTSTLSPVCSASAAFNPLFRHGQAQPPAHTENCCPLLCHPIVTSIACTLVVSSSRRVAAADAHALVSALEDTTAAPHPDGVPEAAKVDS
jgi:hypothetical protein